MYDDYFMTDDTIVAWAGGGAPSALGIVRLSGKRAHDIAGKLTRRKPNACNWHGRDPQTFYTHIYDYARSTVACERNGSGDSDDNVEQVYTHENNGGFDDSRRLIDECIAIWYRAPHSYTGEDMVELSIHGNPLLARELIDACVVAGARDALPGEFTARAFLNGRLDLTQAEAVQELIGAKNRSQLELARNMLKGELRQSVERWYERLVAVRARLEVLFDYPGDTSDASFDHVPSPEGNRAAALAPLSENAENEALRESLASIENEIEELLAFHDRGKSLREGIRVVLVGAPNVGKSSLFNALSGFDRAITDYAPGTTRDYLELTLGWDRLTITLVDTAGLRESNDRVESAGIALTEEKISEADVVVHINDVSASDDKTAGLLGAPSQVTATHQRLVYVFNKVDKIGDDKLTALTDTFSKQTEYPAFLTSAKTKQGVGELRRWLVETLAVDDTSDRVLLTDRHRKLVDDALAALRNASQSLRAGVPTDIVVIDIADAMKYLARITGSDVLSDVFNSIFSNFCVGK